MTTKRVELLGLPIVTSALPDVIDEVRAALRDRRPRAVAFANVHLAELSQRDARVAEALRSCDLLLPDGAPIAWLAGAHANVRVERLPGAEFFHAVCEATAGLYSHFFYGASAATLAKLQAAVRCAHPSIEIVGAYAPPFRTLRSEEAEDVVRTINASGADVVWVGLGAPRQEIWIYEMRHRLDAPIVAAIGAVFDFASGTKQRAPSWMQRSGLEWAHRLVSEPRRLGPRYLQTNTSFTLRLIRHHGELLLDLARVSRRVTKGRSR